MRSMQPAASSAGDGSGSAASADQAAPPQAASPRGEEGAEHRAAERRVAGRRIGLDDQLAPGATGASHSRSRLPSRSISESETSVWPERRADQRAVRDSLGPRRAHRSRRDAAPAHRPVSLVERARAGSGAREPR